MSPSTTQTSGGSKETMSFVLSIVQWPSVDMTFNRASFGSYQDVMLEKASNYSKKQ